MNENNFLSFLQQLMTMTDPDNKESVEMAMTALRSVVALAEASGKVNARTEELMRGARIRFPRLLKFYRHQFVGVPGDYQLNAIKRQRLADALVCCNC